MRWTDVPVHVIDFEGSVRTGVVEYGVVTLQGGEIAAVHTRVCRPLDAIPPAEQRVHGLSADDVAAAELFSADWTLFAGLRETGVLAAHFSATEHRLLRAAWPCPRLSPDFLRPGQHVAEWGPWIDTGRLFVELRSPGVVPTSASLGDVIRALGLEASLIAAAARWCPSARRCFHCAAYDALASALVLSTLAHDASGEPWSLARVLTISTANPARRDERQQARWW